MQSVKIHDMLGCMNVIGWQPKVQNAARALWESAAHKNCQDSSRSTDYTQLHARQHSGKLCVSHERQAALHSALVGGKQEKRVL